MTEQYKTLKQVKKDLAHNEGFDSFIDLMKSAQNDFKLIEYYCDQVTFMYGDIESRRSFSSGYKEGCVRMKKYNDIS